MRQLLFDGRVVVITGACGPVGRASAEAFARQGANVVLAAPEDVALRLLEEACIELGGTAMAVPTDLTRAEQVEQLAEDALAQFGRIDTWCNLADIDADPAGASAGAPEPDAWARMLDAQVHGCANGSRAALRRFQVQRGGVLINHAPTWHGPSRFDSSAASVASAAVRALTRGLHDEWRTVRGVHVCLLMGGRSDTPRTESAGVAPVPTGPAHEVAQAVLHIAQWPRPERSLRESQTRSTTSVATGRAARSRRSAMAPAFEPLLPTVSSAAARSQADTVPAGAVPAGGDTPPDSSVAPRPVYAALVLGVVLGWTTLRRRLRRDAPP